jgi:HAD superfamily hydrolase (TIGR01450 family)
MARDRQARVLSWALPSQTSNAASVMTPDLVKIRHVVLDMDGTMYLGGTLFPETLPFLATLTKLGIGYSFVTNNCSRSRNEYLKHLRELGIHAQPGSLWTSAHATIFYLRLKLPQVDRLFVLGTTGLLDEFREAGFSIVNDDPQAVIVGFDTGLTYDHLAQTAYWITQELPYLATHPDRVCPTDRPIVLPDCGAICALLESATGRWPDAIPGKPSPAMLDAVMHTHGLASCEVAMIGDRLYTDIRMARDAGAIGVLTLTGETKPADLKKCAAADRPHLTIRDLGEMSRLIEEARDAR